MTTRERPGANRANHQTPKPPQDTTTLDTFDVLRAKAASRGLTLLVQKSRAGDRYKLRNGADGEFVSTDLAVIAERIDSTIDLPVTQEPTQSVAVVSTETDVSAEADEPDLTADEARALTDLINVRADALWDLIVQAFKGRAWVALKYRNWDDYCAQELPQLRVPREERQRMAAALLAAGMSKRAIATGLGVSEGTVRNDVNAGAQNYAPDGETGEPIDVEIVDTPEPEQSKGPVKKNPPAKKPAPVGEQSPRKRAIDALRDTTTGNIPVTTLFDIITEVTGNAAPELAGWLANAITKKWGSWTAFDADRRAFNTKTVEDQRALNHQLAKPGRKR